LKTLFTSIEFYLFAALIQTCKKNYSMSNQKISEKKYSVQVKPLHPLLSSFSLTCNSHLPYLSLSLSLFRIFFYFHQPFLLRLCSDLTPVNEINIVIIPKVGSSQNVTYFRPISVINFVAKIISKLLANRLSRVLPNLIHHHQTAFVKNRQISENFLATQELLHHIHCSKQPAMK
jgi:Reverse transcriptase (RNA-dependent DNA polymerase)